MTEAERRVCMIMAQTVTCIRLGISDSWKISNSSGFGCSELLGLFGDRCISIKISE